MVPRAGVSKQSNLASSWSFEDGGVSTPSQISPATAQSESAAAGVVRVREGICFGDDRPDSGKQHTVASPTTSIQGIPAVRGLVWQNTMDGCGWALTTPSHVGRQLVASVAPGDHVMEIGCAFGNVALPVLSAGASMLLVDACPSHLAAVRQSATEQGTVHLLEGERCGYFPEAVSEDTSLMGSFDFIFSSRVFHCGSPESFAMALETCYTLLKPGGTLMLETTGRDNDFYESLWPLFAERKEQNMPFPGFIEDSAVLMPEQAAHLPKEIIVMDTEELQQLVEQNTLFEVTDCYKFLQNRFDEVEPLDSMVGLIARKP